MEIHFAREGLRLGPFNLEQTNRQLARGELRLTDLAWHDGLPAWVPLAQLQGVVPPSASAARLDQVAATADDTEEHYAGFWIRTLAFLLDSILFAIVGALTHFLFRVILGAAGADATTVRVASNLTVTALSFVYFSWGWSSPWQASFGQRLCGLRVIDREGGPVSFVQAVGRYLALILSFILLFLGVLLVIFTRRKQGLHDLIARTVVVRS